MTHVSPPYFFDEYLGSTTRTQPTDRERLLGLTLKDVNWLGTLFVPSDSARQDRDTPMIVETLLLQRPRKPDIALAGALMMSASPEGKKTVLYTPYAGIEVFDQRDGCLAEITRRLRNPLLCIDLKHFLSIEQRNELTHDTPFTLTTATIKYAVFEAQEQAIRANQAMDLQRVLKELRTLPKLPEMLGVALGSMGMTIPGIRGLNLEDTRVNSFMPSTPDNDNGVPRWIGSASLFETFLEYYAKNAWPADRTRTFVTPKHDTSGFTAAQRKKDLANWEKLVQLGASLLSKLLGAQLNTWWNTPIDKGPSGAQQSRMELFTQVMSDKLRAQMLFMRQAGSHALSSEEAHRLLAVFLPDQAARSAWDKSLRFEKIRFYAPYQHYVELAATLLVTDKHAYLYSQSQGLQVFKDVVDLNDTLLSMLKAAGHKDELSNFLSMEERSAYLTMRDAQVRGQAVEGGIFEDMVKGIYDKLLSNLEHALTVFRRSNGTVDLTALLDSSLDIRPMLDSRLLDLDAQGRWSLHPISSDNGRPSTVQAERAKLQLQALQAQEKTLLKHRAKHPTLRSLATKALNDEMKKRYLGLDASDVYVNTYATEAQEREERLPESSVNMVEHFIQRLANTAGLIGSTPRIGFYSARREGAALSWNALNSRIFNDIITQITSKFLGHNVRTLPRRFLKTHADEMVKGLMLGLRSEADLRLLNHTLSPAHHAIIDTVLRADSMTRDNRHGLQGFLPDAFEVTVTIGDHDTPKGLANCFVLTERGGLDPQLSGKVVLWTPQYGHEPFDSLTALRATLTQRLKQSTRRAGLLQNLPISLRPPHQRYKLGPLRRIDSHLLLNRQYSNLDNHLDAIDNWLSMPLGPTQLQDRLDDEMGQTAPSNIGRAKAIANAIIQQQSLPAWLGMASAADQLLHAELLEQYRVSAPDNQDYLHGLPTLREHVTEALKALLKAHFPNDLLDPENILIPARMVLNGYTQSLTDFALRHLPDLLPANLTPSARGTTPLPKSLDGSAIVNIVRQLDIGKIFRNLLTTHLTADTDDARKRRDLFCSQLPWQVLRHAHEEKLDGRLSASAWGFIQQIFDMPDAVARDAVSGATAMIRPLELIAKPGATPAKALGVHVIGPAANATGPLVLYAPYAPFNILKEYGSEEKLLADIYTPGPLQEWILQQLGGPQQATYRDLFKQSAGEEQKKEKSKEVTLASNPTRGNILLHMFQDNADQLLKMLACQFERNGKEQWSAVTNLLRKGLPMAQQFVAGKLKYPMVIWKSFKLFWASANALQDQHFGEGLRTFIQGVATLASLRHPLDELLPSASTPADPDTAKGPEPATTIATLDVTDPLRTWMRRFENVAVALKDLRLDSSSHVYTQPVAHRSYVPVAGRVYPVARSGEYWRVSLPTELGPFVERNAQGQWVLDLSKGHPRFGPAWSRMKTRRAERDSINIEAVGMPAIRGLSFDKGLAIDRALTAALYYTNTCQRNLTLFALQRDPNSRVGRFLTEMFGVFNFNPTQVTKIQDRIKEIMDGLLQPDLIKMDSSRFVYGKARSSRDGAVAFTLDDDAEKKIYLMEPFFKTGTLVYQPYIDVPFDLEDHARAATLIHEISHIVSRTEDIAYLNSMLPFADLINRTTAQGKSFYTSQHTLQTTALSVLTPATMLFKIKNELTGAWEDLGQTQEAETRNKILRLTGASTLNEARQTFMSNADRRLDIILANADSVTFLITHLGRQLDPGA